MTGPTHPRFRTLDHDECVAILSRNHVGRLAYARHDRVDIEPLNYVYHEGWLYGRTSHGAKIDATGTTWAPVAFEVDEVEELFRWRSVVVHGGFYALESEGLEVLRDERQRGVELLRTLVPETFTGADPVAFRTVVFRMAVQEVTGREAVPGDAPAPAAAGDRRQYDADDLLLAEDLGRRCAMALDNARLYAASQEAVRAAEAAREAATFTALRAEELLGEANLARHEAEEANSAKSAFLGTISHEFRTPLTAIQGFTDLLADEVSGPVNEKQRNDLARIRAASDHLLTLIDEILAFARQQAGYSELRLREVDLAALVREAAALVEPLAAAKGLAFTLHLPPGPIPFRTEPGKIRLIILNLAANAVKFTDAGEVTLALEKSGDSVLLRVGDTGMGIPPEHAEHVFSAFWQVDQSSGRLGGTGLGLAVTRQLARLLGGEVTLEGAPGAGSVFTVLLPPLLPAPEPPRADEAAAAPAQAEQRVKGRRRAPRRGAKAIPPAGA